MSFQDVAEEPLSPDSMLQYRDNFEAEQRRYGHVADNSEWRWRYGTLENVWVYGHNGQVVDATRLRSLSPVHHGTTRPRRLAVRRHQGLAVSFLPAPRHYYHYMLEYVPKCLLILEKMRSLDRTDTILLPPQGEAFGDVVLNEINARHPGTSITRIADHEKIHCSKLLHFEVSYSSKFRLPASRATLRRVSCAVRRYHTMATNDVITNFGERVYVSRADAGMRRIVNEGELIKELDSLGFDVVVPGLFSVAEQIRIFSSARLIVGAHGNGLTNIMFAPEGSIVIEMFGSNFVHGAYAWLAHLRNLNYHHLLFPKHGADSTQDFRVSTKSVMSLCEHLLR